MCEIALRDSSALNIKPLELRIIPDAAIFYSLNMKFRIELAMAFKCPTTPPIYLQVYKDTDRALKVWIIINESNVARFLFEDVED